MASSSQAFPEMPQSSEVECLDKTPPSPEKQRSQSPEQCSICLSAFKDKSFTDSCFHTFCFSCLQEWAKVKPVCPLCKTSFNSIIHNIKSNEEYDRIYLPTPSSRTENEERRFRYATTLTHERHLLLEARRMRQFARDARREERHRREEASLSRRQLIYSAGLRVLHMGSNQYSQFRDISPEFFRANPAVTHRLVPWLRRELSVLFDNQEEHVTFMTHYILSLVTNIEIQSEEFHINLRPFLHDTVEHFVHEFVNFSRSPYDMETYDQMSQYDFSGGGVARAHVRRPNQPLLASLQHDSDSDEPSVVLLSDHDSEPMVISDGNASDNDIEQVPNIETYSAGEINSGMIEEALASSNQPTDMHPVFTINDESPLHVLEPTPRPDPEPMSRSDPEPMSRPDPDPIPRPDPDPITRPDPDPIPRPDPDPIPDPESSVQVELNCPGPSGIQSVPAEVHIKEEPPDFHDSDHSDIEYVGFLKPAHMRTPVDDMVSSESETEKIAHEESERRWQIEKARRKKLRDKLKKEAEQNDVIISTGTSSDQGSSRRLESSQESRRRRCRSRSNSCYRPRTRRSRSPDLGHRRSTSNNRYRSRSKSRTPPPKSWRERFGYADPSPSPPKVSHSSSKRRSRSGERGHETASHGSRRKRRSRSQDRVSFSSHSRRRSRSRGRVDDAVSYSSRRRSRSQDRVYETVSYSSSSRRRSRSRDRADEAVSVSYSSSRRPSRSRDREHETTSRASTSRRGKSKSKERSPSPRSLRSREDRSCSKGKSTKVKNHSKHKKSHKKHSKRRSRSRSRSKRH